MINRQAMVQRHHPTLTSPDAVSPLSVGNGEFAFTVDITGLQTFTDWHDPTIAKPEGRSAMPLGTQSQWGFHEMPNPQGFTLDDVMAPYDTPTRTVDYPVRYDFNRDRDQLDEDEQAGYFFWVNPQRLHLGHLGFRLRDRPEAAPLTEPGALTDTHQTLDLWAGRIESSFGFADHGVRVQTACHPERDLVATRVDSPLLADGRATIALRFPYASDTFAKTVDWEHPDAHVTAVERIGPKHVRFLRTLDDDHYVADLSWNGTADLTQSGPHEFELTSTAETVEIVLEFSPHLVHSRRQRPSFDEVLLAAERHWSIFWSTGAAVDFAGSTDPLAAELERRVVLSQYLTAIQCAGTTPPQESGLVVNSWAGKFHLEMHFWHAAHFPLWSRPALLERSLDWYQQILPVARATAKQQGYVGARWPKHVGPAGRESPNEIGPLLIWQQPHPIHFAELLRLSTPPGPVETPILDRYAEIVEESASFIVSVLHWDNEGTAHLAPPLVPAQEDYDPRTVWDPTFELAYCWWAVEVAQQWRTRRGLKRHQSWDVALDQLALPSVTDETYDAVARPGRTTRKDHPSLLGALGMVPQTPIIDRETMRRTLFAVLDDWDWVSAWGWDFPMIAMCATRLGERRAAVEALMRPAAKNTYLPNGHNFQVANRLPLYLPGNGGLLSAVALMVAGWVGCTEELPGIPDDGSWTVAWEGFAPRP